ncbi:MAG: hypothetical protein D6762_06465 [Candidatus Neomarinimicrobiota bacterium]|nr:MAG: hypothetical protein D6762_06465 [Candidatus Neomarinimicrobiota bacterium]
MTAVKSSMAEDLRQWGQEYTRRWLAALRRKGQPDWKLYRYIRNRPGPAAEPVRLRNTRLVLISSAGAYDPTCQLPFQAASLLGDYSLRLLPADTDPGRLQFAHDHYDHRYVEADRNVLIPLDRLRELVQEGFLGSVTESWISFMGYQPDIRRVLRQLIPQIRDQVRMMEAEAALLVPS